MLFKGPFHEKSLKTTNLIPQNQFMYFLFFLFFHATPLLFSLKASRIYLCNLCDVVLSFPAFLFPYKLFIDRRYLTLFNLPGTILFPSIEKTEKFLNLLKLPRGLGWTLWWDGCSPTTLPSSREKGNELMWTDTLVLTRWHFEVKEQTWI